MHTICRPSAHPLERFFLDGKIAENYTKEDKMLMVFGYFSLLAIILSCLGPFGLALFTAAQRTKEVGIRKVMGAGNGMTATLLTRDFVWLVLIANIPALPAAWYFLHHCSRHLPVAWTWPGGNSQQGASLRSL